MNTAIRLHRNTSPHYRGIRLPSSLSFSSVYQPIVSPTHRKLVGFEALVRTQQDGKPLSPEKLFELARKNNQSMELDRHLVHRHVDHFAGQMRPSWLFVNINPHTCLTSDQFLYNLADNCEKKGISPSHLVLELVETRTSNKNDMLRFIDQARDIGFRIAIDDFGMEDSNFERLWRINPLIVKMDRSLLVNAEQDRRARLLLESLVKMIRESGSLVLIEGIENANHVHIAQAAEADLLQGYLFGRPVPLVEQTIEQTEARLGNLLDHTGHLSRQAIMEQNDYLRALRMETMNSCHELLRQSGLQQACNSLLSLPGVTRCFILDPSGIQRSNLAVTGNNKKNCDFNPMYESAGACWAHRDYFSNAVRNPHQIHVSRPYVALPDARRTITLSTTISGSVDSGILCVDIHPDELDYTNSLFPDVL